jgi:hypothetical protein
MVTHLNARPGPIARQECPAQRPARSARGCATRFMSQASLGILERGMPNRSRDWLSQAQRDLEQAGEKAVKALHSHPEGAPFEHYGPLQSQEAIGYAGQILEFVRAQMA